jgi:uncharacterized Zn finger protein
MFDKIFGRLMFGYTDCPNCTCRQSTLHRKRLINLERCLCCGHVFKVKNENFQETKLGNFSD